AELQAHAAVPAVDVIAREVGRGYGIPQEANELRFDESGHLGGYGRRDEIAERNARGRGRVALQQGGARACDGGDAIVVLGVRRRVGVRRSLHRRSRDRRGQLIEWLPGRGAVDVIAENHRRALIANRLFRFVPRHDHALGLGRCFYARGRYGNGERHDDGEIRRGAARDGALGHDGVRQTHRTAVRRPQRRRVGEQEPRARRRVRKVGLFYAVYLRAEPDELRLRYGRDFREQHDRQRLRRIDVARLQRFRIAAAGCDRHRLDVTMNRDPAHLGQAPAGRRHRRIAPRKNHLVGTLCYNQIGRRLRNDGDRRLRIAAFTTGDGGEKEHEKNPLHRRGF